MLTNSEKIAIWERGDDKLIAKACFRSHVLGQHDEINQIMDSLGYYYTKSVIRLNSNEWRKKERVKSRTEEIIKQGKALFITLTFRDDVLRNTTKETRRTYVRKFLKSFADVYVANIDYSPDVGREHYHALVRTNERVSHKWWEDHCGFLSVKKVRNQDLDVARTAKYLVKLCRHALKEWKARGYDGSLRLIYSRAARGEK